MSSSLSTSWGTPTPEHSPPPVCLPGTRLPHPGWDLSIRAGIPPLTARPCSAFTLSQRVLVCVADQLEVVFKSGVEGRVSSQHSAVYIKHVVLSNTTEAQVTETADSRKSLPDGASDTSAMRRRVAVIFAVRKSREAMRICGPSPLWCG